MADLDFYENGQHVHELCEKTGVSLTDLTALGHRAVARGVSVVAPERVIRYIQDPPRTASVLRTITPRWADLEGTSLATEGGFAKRLPVLIPFGRNSCPYDTCFHNAIADRVYLIQRDRITIAMRNRLPRLARAFYDVCTRAELASQPASSLVASRNEIALLASSIDEHTFPWGQMQELHVVFQHLYHDLPQYTFTELVANICCDGVAKIFPVKTPKRMHLIVLTRPTETDTVSQALCYYFINDSDQLRTQVPLPCTRGEQCAKQGARVRIVQDTLPARLVIKLPEQVTKSLNKTWRFDDDLTITYYNRELRRATATYTIQSFVLYSGSNHYFYRRFDRLPDGQRALFDFDNLASAEVRSWKTNDPFYKTRSSTSVYMAIYRRNEAACGPGWG